MSTVLTWKLHGIDVALRVEVAVRVDVALSLTVGECGARDNALIIQAVRRGTSGVGLL